MRFLVIAAAISALAVVSSPAAAQGTWCSEDMNARNCGFYSREQCMANASGLNAMCNPNPFIAKTPAAEPAKPGKRTRHSK